MKIKFIYKLLSTVFLMYSYFLTPALAATVAKPWERTEADSCDSGRCVAASQKSNLLQFCESLKERAAWAQDWSCQNTAIFDDGNDREILYELRKKPVNTLTDNEKALLRAADQYGNVGFCSKAGGNATLIIHNGRPAIITSAHLLLDPKTGKSRCNNQELKNASFMPNVSYYDKNSSDHPQSFTHRRVGLEMPGVSMERDYSFGKMDAKDDFIIFYLKEDITKDVMPKGAGGFGGHQRGAMSVASKSKRTGEMHMIGIAPDIRQGLAVIRQTCDYRDFGLGNLTHNCDTLVGSSGSALTVVEDGELKLLGVHHGSLTSGQVLPHTDDPYDWNIGTGLVGNRKFK